MQNYFYYDNSGKEIGPLDLTTLAQLRFAGVLNDDTPVRPTDSEKWTPCREVVAAPADPVPTQPINAGTGKTSIPPALVVLAIIGALIYGGTVLYKSIAARTALTYGFVLDGKEMSKGQMPEITVDGQLFGSGDHLKPGRHDISVAMQNVEPYEQHFWVFYGIKDLGNLPLETSKGNLVVIVNPSPATVLVQRGGETVNQGAAPLDVEKLPVGNYTLVVKRGDYQETRTVDVQRQQTTNETVELNLGKVELSSVPADAEYEMSGGGHRWQGKLPAHIEDVPVGNYSLSITRRDWELDSVVSAVRGSVTTKKMEFSYGSIEVTSEPTGLVVLKNGVEIGKTPITLQELKPATYNLTVSDGDNDLMADVGVSPKENVKQPFVFRYGMIQLMSVPAGATVIRKGKEIGKTPLTLNRVPVGNSSVGLNLNGYVATNLIISAVENAVTNFSVKLTSEQYLQAMGQAQEALDSGQLVDAKAAIAKALAVDPDDPAAVKLQATIGEAEQAAEKARLQSEQQAASEKRQANEKRFQHLIASTQNARLFPNYTRTYSAPFNKVWNSTLNILTQQKEESIHSNAETGIITTTSTQHSILILSLHANQYLIFVEQNADNTTTINLDLISYFADFNNGSPTWRQMSSDFLQSMANGFLDKIGRGLNPPVPK